MKYILIFTMLFLFACEETVEDAELDYVNQLVVQGFVTANLTTQVALISKTVPPLEDATNEAVEVRDSVAKLIYDQKEYYYRKACPSDVTCLEFVIDTLRVNPGDQLIFEGQGDGKKATAIVNIPEDRPLNASVLYRTERSEFSFSKDSTVVISVEFDTSSDYVYKLNRNIFGSFTEFFIGNNNRVRRDVAAIDFDTKEELDEILNDYKRNNIQVHVHELAMKVYDDTRYQGDGFDGLFSGSGLNIEGNIENGIGILAGRIIYFIEVDELIEIK